MRTAIDISSELRAELDAYTERHEPVKGAFFAFVPHREEVTSGGIILPEEVRDVAAPKQRNAVELGLVMRTNGHQVRYDEKEDEDLHFPLDFGVGDWVLIHRSRGEARRQVVPKHGIIWHADVEDVFAVVPEPHGVET